MWTLAPDTHAPTYPRPRGEGPLIVIDDDQLDLRIARRCHARSRIDRQLLTFDQATPALAAIRRAATADEADIPSMVILDLMESRTPGLHGLDVVAEIHALTPDLPVVVLTASTMDSYRQLAEARGCAAFIRKSARTADLLAMFEALGP